MKLAPWKLLESLAVTIDPRLHFSEHVNSTCKKASQRIAVLMRLKNPIQGSCVTLANILRPGVPGGRNCSRMTDLQPKHLICLKGALVEKI